MRAGGLCQVTANDFENILVHRQRQTAATLILKAKEYATESDRLHNFHCAAAILGTRPEWALMGMLSKHLVSVIDMARSARPVTQAMIDEKIGDTINYLHLLEAVLIDRDNLGVPK